MKQKPESNIRHICVHCSFERFLSHARRGLPAEDIAGVYGNKHHAVTAAIGLLRSLRQSPENSGSTAPAPTTVATAGMPSRFSVVKYQPPTRL